MVPAAVVRRLEKNRQMNKGMEIKLARSNITKQVGGSLLYSILILGRTLAPNIGKPLGLSALAGLVPEGASLVEAENRFTHCCNPIKLTKDKQEDFWGLF